MHVRVSRLKVSAKDVDGTDQKLKQNTALLMGVLDAAWVVSDQAAVVLLATHMSNWQRAVVC